MKNNIEWDEMGDLGFTKVLTKRGRASHYYTVTKPINIDWPEKSKIINFCDGGPCNFGGSVDIIDNVKSNVIVYVD